MHEGPDIHGCHLPVILPIVPDHSGEHLTDHIGRDHFHPLRHSPHQLELFLRQADQAPTYRVLVLTCRLPDQMLYPPLTLGQQRFNGFSWNTIFINPLLYCRSIILLFLLLLQPTPTLACSMYWKKFVSQWVWSVIMSYFNYKQDFLLSTSDALLLSSSASYSSQCAEKNCKLASV